MIDGTYAIDSYILITLIWDFVFFSETRFSSKNVYRNEPTQMSDCDQLPEGL